MDIKAYNQRERRLRLREKLFEIEEKRRMGAVDMDVEEFIEKLRQKLLGCQNV